MPHKKFKVVAVLFFCFVSLLFLFFSPKFESKAQNDGSPPVLEDFALSTNEVNSDDEDELTVYVRVSDNSGISNISGSLRPMAYDEETNSETQSLSLTFALALDCSGLGDVLDLTNLTGCGDGYDGVYSATVAFPLGSTLGDWKVESISIMANEGWLDIGYSELETTYGTGSATIENVGLIEDTNGPEIVSWDFDQDSIDTDDEDQTLILTMHITDDISGVPENFSLDFISPGESSSVIFSMELKDAGTCNDMYVGEVGNCGDKNDGIYESTVTTIPRWSAIGVWTLNYMTSDILGNSGTLPVDPVFFTNNADTEDLIDPVIKSFEIDKTSFDTSQGDVTITITMELEDDLSGINIDRYSSNINFRPVFEWNGGIQAEDFELVSGDINNGIFTAGIIIPQGSKPGFWSFDGGQIADLAGNGTSIDFTEYIEETYIANTAISNEVTIANLWWLEGEGLESISYEGQTRVHSFWPSIVIIFQEDTVVTKQGGGNFGIHRMVSESYVSEKYTTLESLLNEANSELTADIAKCDVSEGCVASQLNDRNLVGRPINIGKVGLPGLGLSFSKPVTIILAVDAKYLGQTLTIQTFDGTQWVEQGTCLVKTYDHMDPSQGGNDEDWYKAVSYPGCSFTTDHASFFSANVLGEETVQLPGVPETGLGGTASLLERYIGWSR
jgi:hypothetical protein